MESAMFGTFWSLVPPVTAIVLALITKEVYSSLFIGVLLGALFTANFSPWGTFETLFTTMVNSMDMNIIIFDVLLGMIIARAVRLLTATGRPATSKTSVRLCWPLPAWAA